MPLTFRPRRASALLLVLFACANCLTASAEAQTVPPQDEAPEQPAGVAHEPVFQVLAPDNNHLKIVEKFAKIVELENKIVRVDGFDPAVIKVTALTPNQLRVQALTPGVTTMVVVDETDQMHVVDIFVTGDVRHLQAYLTRLFPRAAVEAVAVRDSVVLRGWVTQPEHITEIAEIAEQFYPRVLNQMRVGGGQQVLLKVRVMEVQRSKIRRLGINWVAIGENGEFFSSTPGGLTPLAGLVPLEVAQASLSGTTNAFAAVGDNFQFNAFFDALKEEGLLKILAEPELVTMNGRPANMLSGGEFPILVPQSLGTTTIQWRQFGVSLEAVPIILGNGRVRLELQPEVSERDFTNAVDVNGFTVPGLTTRRVNTQVEMRFGETLMLSGLLSMRKTGQTDKTPFFGELPWIGAAFRRVRYDETETELVIMVTPELVAPLAPGQVPPGGPGLFTDTPTDRELYGMGMLEVPNYGDHCEGGNCGPAGLMPDHPGLIGPPGMIAPPGITPTPVPASEFPLHQPPPAPSEMPAPPREMLAPPPEPFVPPLAPPAAPSEQSASRPHISSPRMTGPQPVSYARPAPGHAFPPQGFQKPGTHAPTGIQPPRTTRRGLIAPPQGMAAPAPAPAMQAPPPRRQPGMTSTNPFFTRRPGS